jgi:2-phosphosulfolactate phosphatase
MKIDLIISADDIKKEKVEGSAVVVIDMLRATSVIVTALNNGCRRVIPVLTVEEALDIASKDKNEYLLGGERKAVRIEGFHFSNSPLEYTKESVYGKSLIMTTTNGTKAIKGSEGAKHIFIGALINAEAVAKKLLELGEDVTILNAGTYGQFSIDDFICSGYIIDRIMESKECELTDIAKTAHYIYKMNPDVIGFIKNAAHYKRIMELKLKDDLDYCCRKDIISKVPEYVNGVIL